MTPEKKKLIEELARAEWDARQKMNSCYASNIPIDPLKASEAMVNCRLAEAEWLEADKKLREAMTS